MAIENVPTGNFETTPEVELLLRLMELTESESTPILWKTFRSIAPPNSSEADIARVDNPAQIVPPISA